VRLQAFHYLTAPMRPRTVRGRRGKDFFAIAFFDDSSGLQHGDPAAERADDGQSVADKATDKLKSRCSSGRKSSTCACVVPIFTCAVLGNKTESYELLKQAQELRLRLDAHGSVSVQEGQPLQR
jgi:hypothetical protein